MTSASVSSLSTASPVRVPGTAPASAGVELHALAGDVVRELIRRDPALWALVQQDPELRRQFGFEER